MSARLPIRKTYQLFIGGKFPRSESGRCLPARSARGMRLDDVAQASRKDFRDAVVAAFAEILPTSDLPGGVVNILGPLPATSGSSCRRPPAQLER